MTDQTVAWIVYQKALTPTTPFFIYYAPGAVHAPHHVPADWIAKWKGKFDGGWDVMREQILARQIELGVVPKGTKLAPKPEAIPDWDSLSADEKKLFTRQAEVFAAFLDMTDHSVGRVIDAIEQTGQLDNTLVILVYGDNGTSAEGGRNGMFTNMTYFNGVQETVPDMLKSSTNGAARNLSAHGRRLGRHVRHPLHLDQTGRSDHGGTKVGMAIHWPKGIKAKGELRTQFHHVIDVAPTILEAAKLPEPKDGQRHRTTPDGRRQHGLLFDDAGQGAAHHPVLRNVRQPRHLSRRLVRPHHPQSPVGTQAPPRRSTTIPPGNSSTPRKDFSLVNNLAAQASGKTQGTPRRSS
jgi:arylsulfatase A-like enzyme